MWLVMLLWPAKLAQWPLTSAFGRLCGSLLSASAVFLAHFATIMSYITTHATTYSGSHVTEESDMPIGQEDSPLKGVLESTHRTHVVNNK